MILKKLMNFLNPFKSTVAIKGWVIAELRGPDGELKMRQEMHNLVTEEGDFKTAEAFFTAAYSTWGMKLGTANTAASKDGAGSYIAAGDYVSGSAQALDDSTPKAGVTADIVQFRRLWAAGEGTDNTINRVSICANTTDAGEADATGTFAIAVFAAQIAKAAGDTLTVTWNVTMLGA